MGAPEVGCLCFFKKKKKKQSEKKPHRMTRRCYFGLGKHSFRTAKPIAGELQTSREAIEPRSVGPRAQGRAGDGCPKLPPSSCHRSQPRLLQQGPSCRFTHPESRPSFLKFSIIFGEFQAPKATPKPTSCGGGGFVRPNGPRDRSEMPSHSRRGWRQPSHRVKI